MDINKTILIVMLYVVYPDINKFSVLSDKWILNWTDDFTNNQINEDIWYFDKEDIGKSYDHRCFINNMKVVDQKLSLGFRKNNLINVSNTCDVFVPGISTKFGHTYGKLEMNASIEYSNAVVFILLVPENSIYGPGKISGYINTFILNKEYLKQQSYHGGFGIQYGEDISEYTSLDKTQLSLIKSGFHVFVFEWNKVEMVWKIDQNLLLKKSLNRYFKISDTNGHYAEKGQPFDHNYRLFLANQIAHGVKYKDINENFTDTQFIIDYVKYYTWNQDETETSVANISSTSTNDYTFLVIILTTIIITIIILLPISLFIFYKIRKGNQNLSNSSTTRNIIKGPDYVYETFHYDLELQEHRKHNYETPNAYDYSLAPNNYTEIFP